MAKKFKILSADLLIADIVTDHPDKNAKMRSLVDNYQRQGKLGEGSKGTITKEELPQFAEAAPLHERIKAGMVIPGGSSANTLVTLRKILPNDVDVDFFGVVGKSEIPGDPNDQIITSLNEAGVNLLPVPEKEGMPKESALSYVVPFSDRAIVTYAGNAREFLKAPIITDKLFEGDKGCDAVLVQGSLWQKLRETDPVHGGHQNDDQKLGFADKLLNMRWKHNKELWLAMPTQAEFGKTPLTHSQKADHFKKLIASANVILGNDEELARVFTNEDEYIKIIETLQERGITNPMLKRKNAQKLLLDEGLISKEEAELYDFPNKSICTNEALDRLRDYLKAHPLQKLAQQEHYRGSTKQVAYISRGSEGAVAIDSDGRRSERPALSQDVPRKYTLGAGDASFAGFLAGYIKHLPMKAAPYDNHLEVAMAVAAAKVTQERPSARVDDPRHYLIEKGFMSPEAGFDKAPRLTYPPRLLKEWIADANIKGKYTLGR